MAEQAAISALSRGAIDGMINPHDSNNLVAQPVLQLVLLKPMAKSEPGAGQRYRLVLSDMTNYSQGMLTSTMNHRVDSGELKTFSLIRLTDFTVNLIANPNKPKRKVIVVTNLEVLSQYWPLTKLGTPTEAELRDSANGQPQNTIISSNGAISGREFYGNQPQQPAQQKAQQQRPQQPKQQSSGNPRTSSYANLSAIDSLSPYAHKWAIRARCSQKSEIKTWQNRNGEGKLFSVNLLDESGEIRATGFNDQCDALYDLFQEGSVYYVSSPCKVQLAKKQFSNLSNDYELMFERDTVVERAENQDDVPKVKFNFTPIGDLQSVEKETTIDTIGVLKEIGDVNEITAKNTSKTYDKRELVLVDESGFQVRLTIWGKTATSFDAELESIVAFKGVKVSDFGGRSLSLLSSGSMAFNPDIDEAHRLRGWYDAAGRDEKFNTHTSAAGATGAGRDESAKTIAEVKDENLGMSGDAVYFNVKATIVYITQNNISYPACGTCNRKVVQEESGWRCEKCNVTHPEPEYRFKLYMNVSDHTGQIWLSSFDEVGRQIMGMSANQLNEASQNDETATSRAFKDADSQSFIFRCRAKMDTYQDQTSVKYSIASIFPINYAKESEKLMATLKLYD